MQTKCKSCYYLDSDKKCSREILTSIDNLIEYDDKENPIIHNYKCLYAFPNESVFKEQNFTDKEISDLRNSKMPKVNLSIVIDDFIHKDEQKYKDCVNYVTSFIKSSDTFHISHITTLISSEFENKELYVNHFNDCDMGCKWKICAIRVTCDDCFRFLFSLDHIKSKTVLYIKPQISTDDIKNILDTIYSLSIVKQKPYIFIKGKQSNLSDNISNICCNVTNFDILKRNNLNEEDTKMDTYLINNLIARGNAQALVFDAQ